MTWASVMRWPILSAVIPRLFEIGFVYSQPFLINRAIKLAQSPKSEENNNVGYGLIGAYVIVYAGIAVSFLATLPNVLTH